MYTSKEMQVVAVTNRSLCHRPFPEQLEMVCQTHPAFIILREKDLPAQEYEKLAAQVLEPLLPADTGPEKSPPPTREPACPREESFADAAFLGDSRTEGLYLYGGSEEGTYLYAVGTTVESVFTKAT